MKLSNRSKGQIAALKVQLRACEKEMLINIPSNNDIHYDVILDNYKTKQIIRAQIKFCNRLHGKKNLELRLDSRTTKRIFYRYTDIDLLLVYIPKKDVVLSYGKKFFHRKKRLEINLSNPNSKWFYKNFIW